MAVVEYDFENSSVASILNSTAIPAVAPTISTTWSNQGSKSCKLGSNPPAQSSWAYQYWNFNMSPGNGANIRFRYYCYIPASTFPSTNEAMILHACAPWWIRGMVLYSDGSIWWGYIQDATTVNPTNRVGQGLVQVFPAGTITPDTPFRVEYYKTTGGVGHHELFIGANKDGTTPSAYVASNDYLMTDYSGDCVPYIGIGKWNYVTQYAVNSAMYIDDVAWEDGNAVEARIGPAAPSNIKQATATLSNTATLSASGWRTLSGSPAQMANTTSLTVSAQRSPGEASVMLWLSYWSSYAPSGALTVNFYNSLGNALNIGTTAVSKADISEFLVGLGDGPYQSGYIEVPVDRLDRHLRVTVNNANCSGHSNYGVEVCLPRPSTPDEDHYVIIDWSLRDQNRRIYQDFYRARSNSSGAFTGGWASERYGLFQIDGFNVEPGPAINSDATITYRWSGTTKMWRFDSWSGTVNLMDHRPNEMPEDMGPCYFSERLRSYPNFETIKTQHVNALKALPYWVNRFLKENNYVCDIVAPTAPPGSVYNALVSQSIGLRAQLDPSSFMSANGTSAPPISQAIAWCREIASDQRDGQVILHEIGHLLDYTGLTFAGHRWGVNPYPAGTYPGEVGTRVTYYDPPANTQIQSQAGFDGLDFGISYYDTEGNIVYGFGGRREFAHVVQETAIKAIYDNPIIVKGSSYYTTTDAEWLAQMFAIYFMRQNPSYVYDSYYDGNTFGYNESIYNSWVTETIELGVLPALNAMVNTHVLSTTGTVIRQAAPSILSNTSSLTVSAQVVVPAEVTLSTAETLSVSSDITRVVTTTLSNTVALSVDTMTSTFSTVSIEETHTLSTSGVVGISAAATLNTSYETSFYAETSGNGSVTLSNTYSLSVSTSTAHMASVVMTATSVLTAGSSTHNASNISLSMTATLTAVATVREVAVLSGWGIVTAGYTS